MAQYMVLGYIGKDGQRHIKAKSLVGYLPDGDSPFEIASVTKPIAGLLVAKLVEQHVLDYDDPLIDCRPRQTNARCFAGESVKLIHLLTHTAGFPLLPNDLAGSVPDYSQKQLASYLQEFRQSRKPGSKFQYSTVGYAVLEQQINDLPHRPVFTNLLAQLVLDPLGMKNTAVWKRPSGDLTNILSIWLPIPDQNWESVGISSRAPAGIGTRESEKTNARWLFLTR